MATVIERLDRLRNRQTLYELVVQHDDGRRLLVQYTGAPTRNRLLTACRRWGAQLARLTGTDTLTFGARMADGAVMGDWRIVWSGLTQREAICAGEPTFIGDMPE